VSKREAEDDYTGDARRSEILARGEQLTDHQVAIRAAVLSLTVRLPVDSTLAASFLDTHGTFSKANEAITEAGHPNNLNVQTEEGTLLARERRDIFLERLGAAMNLARKSMLRRA
jgi:hypothetical protein